MENKPTYEELLDRVTEMELDLETLKTELLNANSREQSKPTPPHPRWEPAPEQTYYYVCANGETYWGFNNGLGLDDKYEIGNVFKTKEDADFIAKHLRVLAEMREWAGAWNDRYILIYSGNEKTFTVHELNLPFLAYGGEIRFASEEDAKNCINAVGEERIIRYYFMINENGDPIGV